MQLLDSRLVEVLVLLFELGHVSKLDRVQKVHQTEQFANVVLQRCSGQQHSVLDHQLVQFDKQHTVLVLETLTLVDNQTLPRVFPEEGAVGNVDDHLVGRHHDVALEVVSATVEEFVVPNNCPRTLGTIVSHNSKIRRPLGKLADPVGQGRVGDDNKTWEGFELVE